MTPSDQQPPAAPPPVETPPDERLESMPPRPGVPYPLTGYDGFRALQARAASATNGHFRRLHPLSLLFGVARLGKGFLLPAIIVLFFTRKGSWEYWLMIMFVPLTALEIYRHFTLHYRIDAGRLVIRQGLIFRRERHIPLARVQNIDLVQNPIHRLLKVAEVRIETAGGSEPEAAFKVVSLAAVDQLRTAVFAGRTADGSGNSAAETVEHHVTSSSSEQAVESASPSTTRVLHRIAFIELVKLGLISNRGLALIFIALGVAWEYDVLDRINIERAVRLAHDETTTVGWPAMVALALAAFVLLRVLSIAWVVLRFFDYRLTRDGDDFRLTCGLLTRITATVPRQRIQLVSIQQTLLQRLVRRASIRVETAGGGGGGDDGERDTHAAVSRRWFVPTIPIEQVPIVLRELRDGLDADYSEARWESLAPGARRRMLSKSLRAALILTIIVAAVFRPWGFLVAFALIPLAMWQATRHAKFLSCARTSKGIVFRSGAWTRRISATFFDKMQLITLCESPFDRRWRMATLCIDTAGAGPAEHVIHMPYLTPETAKSLAGEMAANAETAEFRW